MNTTKTFASLALAAAAGIGLVGCAETNAPAASNTLDANGTYVMAPADGGLYTMTVEGRDVEITHETCPEGGDAAVMDPRDTAFGELAELGPEAADAKSTKLSWLAGGSIAGDDAADAELELLSAGQIARVGGTNFFLLDGSQGTALKSQFNSECAPADESDKPLEETEPSASATPSASASAQDAETSVEEETETPAEPSESPSKTAVIELD